jgi:hypothetical protein
LFGSGLCALVYRTVWLREFRLIFGASTAATAAVLGIFMSGLGVGSLFLAAGLSDRCMLEAAGRGMLINHGLPGPSHWHRPAEDA